MTKYRGKVDGRRRGKYRQFEAKYRYSKEELDHYVGSFLNQNTPFRYLDEGLAVSGVRLSKERSYKLEDNHYSGRGTYHMAGATIFVQYDEHKIAQPDHYAQLLLKIVSNEPIDDVFEQIRELSSGKLKRDSFYLKKR